MIFNVRINLCACHPHEGGSGASESAQGLTRRDNKTVPHPEPPWGSNPAESVKLDSDTLPTELRPLFINNNNYYYYYNTYMAP